MLRSLIQDIEIRDDVSITDYVISCASKFGDKPAMIDGITSRRITYNDVKNTILRARDAFYAHGVRAADVVMVCASNCLEYPLITTGIIGLGAVITTANPDFIQDEIADQMKMSSSAFVICDDASEEKVQTAAANYGSIKKIFSIGSQSGAVSVISMLQETHPRAPHSEINPKEQTAFLPFSSGTTGTPKGVMLTHYNVIANIHQITGDQFKTKHTGADVLLCVVPMYHMYGLTLLPYLTFTWGDSIVVLPKFDLQSYLHCIQTYKVSALHVVPHIAVSLSKDPLVSDYDTSSVHMVLSGAAPFGELQGNALMQRLTSIDSLRQAYGLTETSPIVTISTRDSPKCSGSVGRLVPNTLAKVVDDNTGRILGPYESGEFWVKGPQVMTGYLNRPEATAQSIDSDGWFKTGDILYHDEDENFYVVDRSKELIKFKGLQVSPTELESLLLSHHAVSDAAVVAVPDEEAGELPKAFVVIKPGHSTTTEELQQFVKDRVSPHKELRGGIEFIDEIPKSRSGKLLRRELRKRPQT